MTDTTKLLLAFSEKTGVAGLESEAAEYGKTLLAQYGEVTVSPLGSVICTVEKPAKDGRHIMLDAHIDEIGMIVTYIEDRGFLRVFQCGSMDRRGLLASAVTVHAQNGKVTGVICSVPPHLNDDKDRKNKAVDEIYIDIGVSSKEEAEAMVRQGDRVTLNSQPRELLNGIVSGKALDDRAGCVALLKALEQLCIKDKPLGCGLTVVFSSMEEIGLKGAQAAAYEVNPTHALAVDVTSAYTPDSQKEQCGEMKKGPMVGFAPILDTSFSKLLVQLAERDGIPFQHEVMGARTGTNADAIALTRGGVRTAVVSIPLKYMHTPIETVAVSDVKDTGKLVAAFVREIAKEAGDND